MGVIVKESKGTYLLVFKKAKLGCVREKEFDPARKYVLSVDFKRLLCLTIRKNGLDNNTMKWI